MDFEPFPVAAGIRLYQSNPTEATFNGPIVVEAFANVRGGGDCRLLALRCGPCRSLGRCRRRGARGAKRGSRWSND